MSNFRHPDDGVKVRSFGLTLPDARAFAAHRALAPPAAGWHQLMYATRGALTVRAAECAWVAPPHRAVWIPAGFEYSLEVTGGVALRTLYISASFSHGARTCRVVNVSPLLRELILRVVKLGALDAGKAQQRRLTGVLFDELQELPGVPLQLPLPRDERAARFAAMAASGNEVVEKMLRECAASRRTMERLFREETGMSLGQWLRRQRLLHALRRLAVGETVQAIAQELGYSGPSAFIAMFRRELGESPTRYSGPEFT